MLFCFRIFYMPEPTTEQKLRNAWIQHAVAKDTGNQQEAKKHALSCIHWMRHHLGPEKFEDKNEWVNVLNSERTNTHKAVLADIEELIKASND